MNINFEMNTENGGPDRKASTEQVFFGSWQGVEGIFLHALVETVCTGLARLHQEEKYHNAACPCKDPALRLSE